jgi:hypothetical protein
VVTVPGRGTAPDVLWKRFAHLVGLEPDAFDLTTPRSNESLKAEQAELLRRVNLRLGDRLGARGAYAATVKEVFAQGILAGRPGRAIALSEGDRAFALTRSEALVDELEMLGVDIVGDLAELIPADGLPTSAEDGTEHPETTTDAVLLDESVHALADLLTRFSRERERAAQGMRLRLEFDRARAEAGGLRGLTERLRIGMVYRLMRRLALRESDRRPWLMKARVGYWQVARVARRLRALPRRR